MSTPTVKELSVKVSDLEKKVAELSTKMSATVLPTHVVMAWPYPAAHYPRYVWNGYYWVAAY